MGNSVKSRTLEFIKHKRISVKEFENRCGLSNGYVSSMRKGFGREKLENVLNEFPELNRDWLLYGEGVMIEESVEGVRVLPTPTEGATPVYDVNSTCGNSSLPMEFLDEHIIGYVSLPNVSTSASIIRANGDSMEPVINNGDFIAVREITDFDDIFYGQIYLVITAQHRMVKYVRRYADDERNYLVLRSANSNYDDMLQAKSKILKMFIVESILSLRLRI